MMKMLVRATLMGFLEANEAALATKVMNAAAALLAAQVLVTVFAAFLPLVVFAEAVTHWPGPARGIPGAELVEV